MNRTDRLMAIVLELQKHKQRRAEDLAATFETSLRTIYRDVQALSEAGVPILAVTGQGYSLMEGYFLPPISFKAEEAASLLLGADVIEQQLDEGYRQYARSAKDKIEASLPDHVLQQVREQRMRVRFWSMPPRKQDFLHQIRIAVYEGRTVRFWYKKQQRMGTVGKADEKAQAREVDPYGLVHIHGVWHIVGYCHIRSDLRQFRLDRVQELAWTGELFVRPESFNIHDYRPSNDRPVTVNIRLDAQAIGRFRETSYYGVVHEEEKDDGLYVTLQLRYEEEMMRWLLGFGAQVTVLEPPSLRKKLAKEARSIAAIYGVDEE